MKTIELPFIKKLSEFPQFIQVVLGARQVGKTTTILNYLEREKKGKFHYISTETVFIADSSFILEQWQKARLENKLLVIDEIQKIDNWAEIIKKLWDEEKRRSSPIKCILLGSSSLKIQKGLTESLAGRFLLTPVFHWNYTESQEASNLSFDNFLKHGGYPGSYPLIKDKKEWLNYIKNSIIEAVIEKDILSIHTVKSPALFKQTFQLLISYPAKEISFTKLLGKIQDKGNTDLIKHYLSLFEGSYLIKVLEKYSEKPIKRKTSSPKILPLCPAFYYFTINDEFTNEEKGRVFELIVGAQLSKLEGELYYWRERNNEVDFVLKQGRTLYAIEVKSGKIKSLKGLEAFLNKFTNAKAVVITLDNYKEFDKNPQNFLNNCIDFSLIS